MRDGLTAMADHLARRRTIFYPKADIDVPDSVLRAMALTGEAGSGALWEQALTASGFPSRSLVPMRHQGTFHALYLCQSTAAAPPVVLRVNRVAAHLIDWQLMVEQAVSRRLAADGIVHPAILVADCSRAQVPFDFQVMEYVDGICLTDLDADDAAVMPPLCATARYLARLHRIEGQGYGFVSGQCDAVGRPVGLQARWGDHVLCRLDEHLAAVETAGLIDGAEAATIRACFAAAADRLMTAPARLLHGDCGNHNIFQLADGGISMIDWEDALIGDPLFEVAFWATFHPVRRWPRFFESYFGRPWRPTSLFWLYFLRIALCKTALRLRFGYTDKPGRPKASLRIQQGLAGLAETGGC